jgi:hypothetical protein
LWNILDIKDCLFIFIFATELGLSVMTLIWIVLDYIDVCVFFWKSPFYYRYNAKKNFRTNWN